MSAEQVEVTVTLENQGVQFKGISNSNIEKPIIFDYLPPMGDGQGFLGLETLVMSFGGCVSTGIVFLLRKMGKDISGYKMSLTGRKRLNPLSLEKINFELLIESKDITAKDMEAVIKQAENISPVWLAIKNNVAVESNYQIVTI